MRVLARIVAALAGAAAGIRPGGSLGCAWYEATGDEYAQCGYEFEGTLHVLVSMAVTMIVFGFLAQWVVGRLMGRDDD